LVENNLHIDHFSSHNEVNVRYDTLGEFNVDSKAEYTA